MKDGQTKGSDVSDSRTTDHAKQMPSEGHPTHDTRGSTTSPCVELLGKRRSRVITEFEEEAYEKRENIGPNDSDQP